MGPHTWTLKASWLWPYCSGACLLSRSSAPFSVPCSQGQDPAPGSARVSTHSPHPHPGSVLSEGDLLTHDSPYLSFTNGHPPCRTKDGLPEAPEFTATDSRSFFTEAERPVPASTTVQAPSSSPYQLSPQQGSIPFGE